MTQVRRRETPRDPRAGGGPCSSAGVTLSPAGAYIQLRHVIPHANTPMRAKLLPAALLLLAACSGGATDPDPRLETSPGEILAPTRLEGMPSHHSGIATEQRRVIRTWAELEAFWAELSHPNPFGPVPAVDFNSEMLIVTAMGTRPSGGYRVFVESIGSMGSAYTVVVRSVSPGRDCVTPAVITNPVDILRVPIANQVKFVERREVHSCGP